MNRMAKFMNENIPDEFGGEEQKLLIETDGSPCGTASPSASLAAQLNLLERKARLGGDPFQPWSQAAAALPPQPGE
jgi:hypothetical protein